MGNYVYNFYSFKLLDFALFLFDFFPYIFFILFFLLSCFFSLKSSTYIDGKDIYSGYHYLNLPLRESKIKNCQIKKNREEFRGKTGGKIKTG